MDEVSREITYDSSSSNCSPTISSPASTTIPSTTASGTQVVSGSSLSASDPDGNTLAYSITAGNGGGYFTINTSTGDISTTQVNIPAGTYTLTVQVDDGNGGKANSSVVIIVATPGQGSSTAPGNASATTSTIKAPRTGAIILSLILTPMLIALGIYLYIAHHNSANIKKKSER